jgi:predicted ATPase/DNA-binding winged helix-turn-helix (wHTH) protein
MTGPPPGVTFRFGDFELDPVAYELRGLGRRLRLARQPMEVLLLMLDRRGELVAREDIAARLWPPDVFLDRDAGIHTAMLRIRQALRDSRDAPSFVETVAGKGYRFIALVEVVPRGPVSLAPSSDAPVEAVPRRAHNLPAELTTFVGRRQALLDLAPLVSSARLVSLTGAGGVGKTRLALQLASRIAHTFDDGVWLVDLSPITTTDLVAQTVASVLGVRESPQRTVRDALLEHVAHRHLLFVFDTCEHLLDVCADLVEALLHDAPRVHVVATSREALGVPGEVVYRVPSLSLPTAVTDEWLSSEAAQLFVQRATVIDATFTPAEEDAGVIGRICHRLDGIPLAIELAAARVAVLSLAQIEARLQDRFRLLTGGSRTAVARQRTLEATVEWSCQLLSEAERLLLGRLSVFPSSWTLEAAESICSGDGIDAHDVLDLSSRLVAKSLLSLDRGRPGAGRFRLLETVRQYARERLVQSDAAERVQTRHVAYFVDEFRHALAVLRGPGQLSYLGRLQGEQENLRTALEWALASPDLAAQGVEFAGALFWFWTKRGLFEEGRRWLERAVALEAPDAARARALIGLSHMHYFQGRHESAASAASAALAIGDATSDAWVVSFSRFMQAVTALELGDHGQARALALEAIEAADAGGDVIQHGGPLMILANLALLDGHHARAQALYDQSIDVHRREGDAWGLSILLSMAAGLCIIRKDFTVARAHAAEAMALCEALEDQRGLAWGLEVCAGLLADQGDAEAAAQLWGASNGLMETVGGALAPTIGWIRDRYTAAVRLSIGEGRFAAACAEGRAMPVTQAIALGREQALRAAT